MKCIICKGETRRIPFFHEYSRYDGLYYPLYKCSKCGFTRPNPLPYNDETKLGIYDSTKTIHFYNSKTEKIEFESKEYIYYHKHFKPFIPLIKKYKIKGRALDIGCGTGHLLKLLGDLGFDVDGIDISAVLITALKERFKKVYCIPVEKYRPKKKYNLITLNQVLEHVENPEKFIQDSGKHLVNGGYAIISVPYMFGIVPSILRTYWYGMGAGQHLNFFSPKNIKILLERNGFKVLEFKMLSVDYAHPSFPTILNLIGNIVMKFNIAMGLGDNLFIVAQKV